jgi:hypothetical protein
MNHVSIRSFDVRHQSLVLAQGLLAFTQVELFDATTITDSNIMLDVGKKTEVAEVFVPLLDGFTVWEYLWLKWLLQRTANHSRYRADELTNCRIHEAKDGHSKSNGARKAAKTWFVFTHLRFTGVKT